jgi:uncharacterized membrane protein YgdD (TMEM256/DUF423 family)
MRNWTTFAALSMMLAIVFGAFGAHALKTSLPADQLMSFETGVRYQIYHSLAILITVILHKQLDVSFNVSLWCFGIGMFLFSGSIYFLSTIPIHGVGFLRIMAPVTPIGGLLLLTGWLSMAIALLRRGDRLKR